MKVKLSLNTILTIILALCVVGSAFVVSFAAESPAADAPEEHWASRSVRRWTFLEEGEPGGISAAAAATTEAEENPDGPMTLRESAELFVRLLGLAGEGKYDPVVVCAASGLLRASEAGTLDPDAPLSREDFFMMFARALHIPDAPEEDTDFEDIGLVSDRALGAVYALIRRGYVNGVAQGVLAPGAAITHAGALSLLDRAVAVYADTDSAFVEADGGLVLVTGRDVLVTGTVETLLVAPGALDGGVTLEDAAADRVIAEAPGTLLLTGGTAVGTLRVCDTAAGLRLGIGEDAAVETLVLDTENVEYLDMTAQPEAETPDETDETDEAAELPMETGPEEDPDVPWTVVSAVGRGYVLDYGDLRRLPYTDYTVTAEAAEEGADCDVLVSVSMTGLRPHQSRGAGAGWWTGFSVKAPEGATGAVAEYSTDGKDYGAPVAAALTNGRYARYFDAARWRQYYVRLAWTGPGFEGTEGTVYKLDFSGVGLDLSGLTEEDSPMGRIGTAYIEDRLEGARHREKLYEEYGVSLGRGFGERGGYLEITVRAEGLESHLSGGGEGYWAGFSVAAPAGAAGCRYAAHISEEGARKSFEQRPVMTWEEFYRNVDGEGADGIVQRSDASVEGQRDYWAVLQWFSDEEGTEALTAPEVYHVVLDARLAGAEPA